MYCARILLKVEFVDGVTRLECMKKADSYKVRVIDCVM